MKVVFTLLRHKDLSRNPEGIESYSPGLARVREGLPWVKAFKVQNPEKVQYHAFMQEIQPFQGCGFP
jgi:hypothetical protein